MSKWKLRTGLLLMELCCLGYAAAVYGQKPKNPFTAMEQQHIQVKTPGLWGQGKHLFLHLDSLSRTEWCFPLRGAKVLSPYGKRNGSMHTGCDIKIHAGDTIRSAFRGIVRLSRPYGAYGNVIVIRHAGGLETLYSHNARNLVASGDTVVAGQPIGIVGRTGRATTEHLHLETRIDGEHFNPNILFQMEKGELRPECIRCTRNKKGVVVKPLLTP